MSHHWSTLKVPKCQLIITDFTTNLPEFHEAKEFQLKNQESINTCDTARCTAHKCAGEFCSFGKRGIIITRSTATFYWVCPVTTGLRSTLSSSELCEGNAFAIPILQMRTEVKNSGLTQISHTWVLFNSHNNSSPFQMWETKAQRVETTCQSHTAKVRLWRRLILCWWDWKMVQPLWNIVWRFLRRLNSITISPSNSTPRYIPPNGKHVHTKTCTLGL